jgi:hypothetical protein
MTDGIEEKEVSAELAVFAIPRSLLLAYPS